MGRFGGTRRAGFAAALALIAAAAGCSRPAAAAAQSRSTAAAASSSVVEAAPPPLPGSAPSAGNPTDAPPGSKPTPDPEPSEGPRDLITGYWVLGAVTSGGAGPCYALRTDDGRILALIGRTIGPLAVGDRIRVRVRSDDPPPACGNADALTALEVKRAG